MRKKGIFMHNQKNMFQKEIGSSSIHSSSILRLQ
uniref:Uncharacterized protein n=1 Tax=Arundo donax TaxID=35708 RepID=A0A0A9GYA6_ARUDO